MPGGGGGGGDSVDREYNARMATIAEKQQAMAEEYFQYWKSGPGHWETRPVGGSGYTATGDPQASMQQITGGKLAEYIASSSGIRIPKTEQVWVKDPDGVSYMDMEQAQMKSNMELIPKQTKYMSTFLDAETGLVPQRAGLESAFLNAETGLVPQRAGLESALLNAETGLVPQRAGLESAFLNAETGLVPQRASLESALIAEQQENIALRKPVTSKFYDEVLKGVDVDERVNLARADVESAYASAESNARRWASSMGINPASKSYSAGLMSLAKEKAAAKVGATSLARRQAEEENFARLSGAVGLGSA
jgi:hypothetical protein